MKRDFSTLVRNSDGSTIEIVGEDGKKTGSLFSMKDLASRSLFQFDQGDTPEAKSKKGRLALRIEESSGLMDLTTEEMQLIKAAVGKYRTPLEVVRMEIFLETDPPAPIVAQPVPEAVKGGDDDEEDESPKKSFKSRPINRP